MRALPPLAPNTRQTNAAFPCHFLTMTFKDQGITEPRCFPACWLIPCNCQVKQISETMEFICATPMTFYSNRCLNPSGCLGKLTLEVLFYTHFAYLCRSLCLAP